MQIVTTLEDLLDDYLYKSTSTSERGTKFERLVQAFLKTDTQWSALYDEVWTWSQWPAHHGHDTGIDLVARERDTGGLVAVQCKFYDPSTTIAKQHIDSFLSESGKTFDSASGKQPFTARLIVTTTDKWGPNAEQAIRDQQIPVQRIGLTDLLDSSIDWSQFDQKAPDALKVKARKELMAHQRTALEKVRAGLVVADRGKLIMACGTGKTFTSLRIAEDRVPLGGSVLFLVPSIALLSQALKEWSIEAGHSLRTFAVCSDTKAGQFEEDITTVDLPIPPTTNAAKLAATAGDPSASGRITVVFSTYQSIDVVAQAQRMGLGAFDLVICDEAHRTTGVTLAGEPDESAFVRVHNADYLHATKRLYMTATPRIYDDNSKAKAGQAQAVLASMDDENLYGSELYRLGFGEAVTRNLLTDYKVLVLAVDEGTINQTMQAALTDPANSELKVDDVAKIVGCWNGLAKRGATEHDFATDPEPMHRAVAFSRSIKDSRRFTEKFAEIAEQFQRNTGMREEATRTDTPLLPVAVEHVDGSYNMVARNGLLAWLKDDTDGQCRVLSNAKCLSEGVDVPALDAVLFLNPRKSQVDVVQSVGRVMRRAPGKKYGYIILPIVIPAGMRPEDALRDNERYRVVWEVLQALRAHDERFEALVNKIELNTNRDTRINVIGVGGFDRDEDGTSPTKGTSATGVQGWLDLDALGDFRNALYTKIVQKVGSRRYWEDWARDVATIADKHRQRLVGLLDGGHATVEFDAFHEALKANLNDSITRDDAVDMLSQHLITAPIFSALFADYDFATGNPVAQVMEHMLEALEGTNLQAETAPLDDFYASVRNRVAGIDNAAGRQSIIKDLYERFFKLAFPRAADQLGIVYTPVEIVDFILRSVDHLLRAEFGASLSDEGVHVLDPFTGTGTFIVRLLQSGLIKPHDLARKYASELHANEIMLLAYYIAAINIESAYHDVLRDDLDPGVSYTPFDGIVLTDTFQMSEDGDLDDGSVFTRNSDRVIAQRALDIRVIVGNPPYSVGQTSANDLAANVKYPTLDAKIEATYAAKSAATLKRNLYDSYIRAIRWASDRVGEQGIIGFVTNGGFIDTNNADGLRKVLADEFATIYIYNLRGNQRTAGELSRKEGGKIFGAGSRNTVAMTFLVKRPQHAGKAEVWYRDIGDYLSREEKLRIVGESTLDAVAWVAITPNDAGDWISQRSDEFDQFAPLGGRDGASGRIFARDSLGVSTNRDIWTYAFGSRPLLRGVAATVNAFNEALRCWQVAGSTADESLAVRAMAMADKDLSWSRGLRQRFLQGRRLQLTEDAVTDSLYRPFTRMRFYGGNGLVEVPGQTPRWMAPQGPAYANRAICVLRPNDRTTFSVLATDLVPNLALFMDPAQCFPRWTCEKAEADSAAQEGFDFSGLEVGGGYAWTDNITESAQRQYQAWYGAEVSTDDIFAFIYGFLHSPDYRERFAADLKRSLPRVPRVHAADFAVFRDAGVRLLDLHIGYEDAAPYPLTITGDEPAGPGSGDLYGWYYVEKLRWSGKGKDIDRSTIVYNARITISGIPEIAHRYMLGSRSALEWILDRYQVKTDKASGIVNDPNDWSREVGNPRYILDLIGKVTTVSVETMKIVDSLPPLRIVAE